MPIYRRIDKIDNAFLQSLVDEEVMEDRGLEYKRDLTILIDLPKDVMEREKQEFCGDVSAFANADGGFLIYGMEQDEEGRAKCLYGIPQPENFDNLKNRLLQIIGAGVEPQLYGVEIEKVELDEERITILVQVQPSWSKPHWVGKKGCRTFYTRTSGGKDHLDIRNVRELFVLSETVAGRIRDFHRLRIKGVQGGDVPVLKWTGSRLVLNIIPLSAGSSVQQVDFLEIHNEVFEHGDRRGFNLHGMYSGLQDYYYYQIFRNGSVEYVDAKSSGFTSNVFDIAMFEGNLLRYVLPKILTWQKRMKVSTPIFVMLTFLDLRNRRLRLQNLHGDRLEKTIGHYMFPQDEIFERNEIVFPEVLIDSYVTDLAAVMRPIFDMIWQAAGLPCSLSYDDEGNWDGGLPQGQTHSRP